MTSCAGDWVEVRSKAEILATLDKDGRLDGMPFMPEMLEHCGKRMRVYKRAHKSCDTINPISSRSLTDSVLLEGDRCDGAAHGGCQAQCSVFWKQAWLKPVGGDAATAAQKPAAAGQGCTEAELIAAARNGVTKSGKPIYRCQTTDVPKYTKPLRTRDLSQYTEDLSSRNVGLGELLLTGVYFFYDLVFRPESKRGAPFRWLYDQVQALWGGVPYPRRHGLLKSDAEAPINALDLRPGELVRVKPYKEILATISEGNRHRGLYFDGEMAPYCGGVYRVRTIIHQFLDEWTGVMRTMKTPAVILDNVWCRSRISNKRLLCPRAIYGWWREAWLERAPEATEPSAAKALGARAYLFELTHGEKLRAHAGGRAPPGEGVPAPSVKALAPEEGVS
jgi:hypothetical protein